MAHDAAHRPDAKRTAARRRALRRRAAAWRRAARRAVTLALAAGMLCGPVADARAQMGQAAMAPAAGLVNGGLQRFQNLSENGPGWMYWGLNAADRGLGYVGSYMTLGGFIPMAEDDLGGFWSADLRSHLSNYGGFFSNVGAVRKQFIGGTLLGVGVYWDYDGDQNQYAATPIVGTPYTFAGGQSYNQVGVSGEWLTDWGNLRSNGYIPVGTTAQLTGPFVGNVVLCQNGLNAALSGADLEVGAYVPGLSDWAGMVSVGGYALGNNRYSYPNGTAAVPWFGGVYTRLDMTLLKNWDFSLQANNDSYFDWTGFARLTYRMGGSRRRNVPDQMEQPMMRNEHIVRAYQAPETAINPETGTPWRVFHVDNSVTVPGNGTAESPFATLTQAQSAASAQYDIVYVHVGASASTPYITPVNGYTFQNQNQYLVGEGSTYQFDTLNCGPDALFASSNSSLYPNLTNPIGPAIAVTENGSVVSHLRITRTPVGIVGAGMPAGGVATISDVIVAGGAGILQRGVEITSTAGTFNFDRLQLRDLDDSGLVQTGATSVVNVTNSTFDNVEGTALLVSGSAARATITRTSFDGTTGNGLVASGAGSRIVLTSSTVSNTTGNAIAATGAASTFVGTDFTVRDTGGSGLVASGSGSTVAAVRGSVLTTGGGVDPVRSRIDEHASHAAAIDHPADRRLRDRRAGRVWPQRGRAGVRFDDFRGRTGDLGEKQQSRRGTRPDADQRPDHDDPERGRFRRRRVGQLAGPCRHRLDHRRRHRDPGRQRQRRGGQCRHGHAAHRHEQLDQRDDVRRVGHRIGHVHHVHRESGAGEHRVEPHHDLGVDRHPPRDAESGRLAGTGGCGADLQRRKRRGTRGGQFQHHGPGYAGHDAHAGDLQLAAAAPAPAAVSAHPGRAADAVIAPRKRLLSHTSFPLQTRPCDSRNHSRA
ncbi:MAG: right-handed parallel beta-helix repeat-containing protein [Planctomycetia bacterium]|nr:right-handed parallel beta-helix repeat-containing protein [Planctomycetia bacterium]